MNRYRTIKRARIFIAILVFISVLALFTDLYEWIPSRYFEGILFLQFIPSLLKFIQVFSLLSAGGFLVVLLLTFFTGRLYCSVICPLGILQDLISRVARWRSGKKRFFKYHKPQRLIRYSVLAIMAIAMMAGAGFIVSWLDPYSLAGRFFTYLFKPLVTLTNNLTAGVLSQVDNYLLQQQNLPIPSFVPAIAAFVVLVVIGYMAWKRGRFFCNTICPVGSLLGEISNYSFLKIHFDPAACTRCGKCAGSCKSECIDIKNLSIDYSRCVMCFDCLSSCPDSALSLTFKKTATKTPTVVQETEAVNRKNRRKLLVTGAALLTGHQLLAQRRQQTRNQNQHQHQLKINVKDYPVSPPGSISIDHFNDICTACSLCIAACPTHVLQPALTEYGLMGFMQPHMDYATHYCNFDCTKCGDVCPTGAIQPLSINEKHVTQIGKAIFVRHNCVVRTDGTDCGACSEHCPTKAVHMVPFRNGLLIPEVDKSICIGCGACEHACPVEAPFKAIYVNGNAVHEIADKPEIKAKKEIDTTEDFPF